MEGTLPAHNWEPMLDGLIRNKQYGFKSKLVIIFQATLPHRVVIRIKGSGVRRTMYATLSSWEEGWDKICNNNWKTPLAIA